MALPLTTDKVYIVIPRVHNREECLTSICPIKNEPVKYSKVKQLPLKNCWLVLILPRAGPDWSGGIHDHVLMGVSLLCHKYGIIN